MTGHHTIQLVVHRKKWADFRNKIMVLRSPLILHLSDKYSTRKKNVKTPPVTFCIAKQWKMTTNSGESSAEEGVGGGGGEFKDRGKVLCDRLFFF